MTVPNTTINKSDGNTGVAVLANPVGILAVIAPCEKGSQNLPQFATKPKALLAAMGFGILTAIASYGIPQTGKPMVVVQATPTTPGSYSAFTYTGTGTLAGSITAHGGALPLDDFPVVFRFVVGGTTGTTGITYQYSIDARSVTDPAKVWSPVFALGTALTVSIPNTGMQFDFVTAKTVVAGDSWKVTAKGPRLTTADITTAMNALRASNLPWEAVLVAGHDASSTTISNQDTALAALETNGRYRGFILGAVPRDATTQTEAQYLTAMTAAFGASASIRGCVAADQCIISDPDRGIDMLRSASIPFAVRLMAIDVTQDAAENTSPLSAVRIVDENGSALYHDEALDAGLDDQRLVALRTWNNKIGVFVNNPRVISTPGSDYVFAQHWRTMNRACELAHSALTSELSKGVFKDIVTGRIREDEAARIERVVDSAISSELGKKVPYVKFTLSRDDDLGSNAGATLTGTIDLIMPTYIKAFVVNAKFARTIAAAA